jgi:hypothetical protein
MYIFRHRLLKSVIALYADIQQKKRFPRPSHWEQLELPAPERGEEMGGGGGEETEKRVEGKIGQLSRN